MILKKLSKKRLGQSSVEFVLISSLMFMVFLGMFVVIQGSMAGAYRDRLYAMMGQMSNLVSTEVRMAYNSQGDYSREFSLPPLLEGYTYTISIPDLSEISITAEEIDYVIFLDYNLSVGSNINIGKNLITKVDGNITIKPVS
jgi:hypothetical protein